MAGVGAEFSLEPEFWKNQRTGPLRSSRDLRGTKLLLCRGSALSAMRTVQGPAPGGEQPPAQPAGVCRAGRLSLSPRRTLRLIQHPAPRQCDQHVLPHWRLRFITCDAGSKR